MKGPLENGSWLDLEEIASTQTVVGRYLRGELPGPVPGIVFARNQTEGKGRFGRTWISRPDESLTFSMVFGQYVGHEKPWLIGMAVAIAAAGAVHCQLRWPNDLTVAEKKLGGILTELMPDSSGRLVPVVGVGINLTQTEFPEEIAETATSLAMHRAGPFNPRQIAEKIVERIADLPEPDSWSDLEPIWSLFDATPGKRYRLQSGEEAIAIGVGPEGELLCAVNGEPRTVMAAEAHFGPA
ncbi:MAG: biotin--[acetyl-CoA-carboxylase] ligase [Fimbriimonadaceae bacterium]